MATSSVTRMTNMTGLIDTDALVEAQMLRYKTKINTATQNKMLEEYKQEQYRAITTKAKTFYDKYFTSTGEKSLVKSSAYNVIKFDSSKSSAVTATGSADAKAINYSVNVERLASATSYKVSDTDKTNGLSIKYKDSNGDEKTAIIKLDDVTAGSTDKDKAKYINEQLSAYGIKATASASDLSTGITISSETTGADSNLEAFTSIDTKSANFTAGTNAKVTITDKRRNISKTFDNLTTNSKTVDGVTFSFNDVTSEEVTLSGKNDANTLADNIASFIEDYNDLMGSINTKLYETRDKSYMPLTDEDKEGLTDSQIEKWEKKAQTGLLRNDSYLRSFAEDMKSSMTTMMSGSGLSLEKIGIKPVQDYTTKNGLFTVDKDTLKSALESDPDGVMELFTKGFTDTTASSYSKGIMGRLEENLQYHATTSSSRLAQKSGLAEGVSSISNAMTKDITERKKLIAQMEADYKTRENNLYTKYSKLESSLSALQSQQSTLSSYFTS